jgi:hypothetical protein
MALHVQAAAGATYQIERLEDADLHAHHAKIHARYHAHASQQNIRRPQQQQDEANASSLTSAQQALGCQT